MKKDKKAVSNLKPGQQATLFPSFGYYDEKRNQCRALVHGRVFVDGRIPFGTRILLRGLKRAMKVTPEDIASETFQNRIDGFLTAPGRHRRIVLRIGSKRYRLKRRTRRNGAFYGSLKLPAGIAEQSMQSGVAEVLPMQLLQSTDNIGTIEAAQGKLHFVPPLGISVISDIDDTIKLTGATNKREMLANTFLRPFEVVDGMAALYQKWHSEGCEFHYVSSSPWQLYEPLAELCTSCQFPAGSMHLRYFRVRDEMLKRFRTIRRNSKVGIIVGILKRLPRRRFILIGDSGEKDPEIYRFLAKRFPNRIAAVLIRNVRERPMSEKRIAKLMSVSNTVRSEFPIVRIYEEPAMLSDIVHEIQAKHPN